MRRIHRLKRLKHNSRISLMAHRTGIRNIKTVDLTSLIGTALQVHPSHIILNRYHNTRVISLLHTFGSNRRNNVAAIRTSNISQIPSELVSLKLLTKIDPRTLTVLTTNTFSTIIRLRQIGKRQHVARVNRLHMTRNRLTKAPLTM